MRADEIDWKLLFTLLHPDFFSRDDIKNLPGEYFFDEMALNLRQFNPQKYRRQLDDSVTFGYYNRSIDDLRSAVAKVDEDWPQFFNEGDRIYCGFLGGKIASFCTIADFGTHDVGGIPLRIGGPGCVGTLAEHRDKGIALTMVRNITQILAQEGFDLSYVHYTYVPAWYAKLGYKTVLRWNKSGFSTPAD